MYNFHKLSTFFAVTVFNYIHENMKDIANENIKRRYYRVLAITQEVLRSTIRKSSIEEAIVRKNNP